MSEEMKLGWVVAFTLRGDALDWWISWKDTHPNFGWWEFSKAILKKFQPEVWECLLDSETKEQENRGRDEIHDKNPEPIASQSEKTICDELEGTQIQKYSENEDCAVGTKLDREGDIVKNTNSPTCAAEVKGQRSDEELDKEGGVQGTDVTVPSKFSYPSTSSLLSHLGNSAATEMREIRFSDEPNKRPLPQWFAQQPLLPKPQNIGYHMVIAVVPKIKSRKEKVPLSVSPSFEQSIMRKLTAVSKFDPGENYPISCITQSFCFKLWDPGGYILSP